MDSERATLFFKNHHPELGMSPFNYAHYSDAKERCIKIIKRFKK
jgi:hypothetical protein